VYSCKNWASPDLEFSKAGAEACRGVRVLAGRVGEDGGGASRKEAEEEVEDGARPRG